MDRDVVPDILQLGAVPGGTPIDGVTYELGDRVLLANQTASEENGVYIVGLVDPNTFTAPLTRAPDLPDGVLFTPGAVFEVAEGDYALTTWKAITAGPIIVGTTGFDLYPRTIRDETPLDAGAFTIDCPVLDATRTIVTLTHTTYGSTADLTVEYEVTSRTPGMAGTIVTCGSCPAWRRGRRRTPGCANTPRKHLEIRGGGSARSLPSAGTMSARTSRLLSYVASSLVATSVAVCLFTACGGSTDSSSPSNAGVDGGSRSDRSSSGSSGGADAGGVLAASCPASPPQTGAACSPAGATCEYGGEGSLLLCSTLYTCGESGQWLSNARGAECTGSQAGNAPACPAAFGALASGEACPADIHGTCVYPEGACQCASCVSPDAGGGGRSWSCVPWPAPPGCPTPRPRAGSACSTEGQECGYASVCSSVNLDLPDLKCVGGVWQSQKVLQPPCALPTCGR